MIYLRRSGLKDFANILNIAAKGVVLRKGFLVIAPEKLYLADDVSHLQLT